MSLFKIMAKEDEEILEEKIIKIHQKAKKELLPYLKAYLWSQGLSEDDKAIVEDENLVDIKIGKAGTGETKFLTVNASSLEPKPKPNQNQNNKNLKQQNKREEITDFIGDAITSTLSAMKRAQIAINQKNYADALEYSTLIHESLGCIKVANKLNFFNKLIKKETEDKKKAASARQPHLPQVKEIVLFIAKKHANLFKNPTELFKEIEYECEAEIKIKIKTEPENEAIKWKAGNFGDVFERHVKKDKEFGKNINLLLKPAD